MTSPKSGSLLFPCLKFHHDEHEDFYIIAGVAPAGVIVGAGNFPHNWYDFRLINLLILILLL